MSVGTSTTLVQQKTNCLKLLTKDTGTNVRRTLSFGIVQAPLQKQLASSRLPLFLSSPTFPHRRRPYCRHAATVVFAIATIAILFIYYDIIYVNRYIKFCY